ncbi:pilus assembly protein TadG-related protein [Collimonas arenae]|uniref:pilus assembly protein TadG-related protein n=1 Tax=Collimonas arenae TaxID=279058 RepID=UPI00077838BF|nr:pilus assembly protein TadG-related protein [Collimonas arenae]
MKICGSRQHKYAKEFIQGLEEALRAESVSESPRIVAETVRRPDLTLNVARILPASRRRQRLQQGAVLPIAIFFFAVLCVGLFAVYNMAQVTSDKRHLINAADAIAYSDATIAAEGLNYTAYTNRAMVSNYVAVSQLTGMWSTTTMADQYWRNSPKAIKAIGDLAAFIPEVGPLIKNVANGIAAVQGAVQKVSNLARVTSVVLANAGTAANSLSNYALFAAQQTHLLATLNAIANAQTDLLKANAPDASYIPSIIAYQSLKGVTEFLRMLKLHQPPKKFLGLEKMKTKMPADQEGIEFNLVHRLMTGEMFISPLAAPDAVCSQKYKVCGRWTCVTRNILGKGSVV